MINFRKLHIVLLFFFVTISCIAQTKESNSKYYKGISYVDKNNYAKAIEEFKECLKTDTVATLTFNLGINSHDWVAYCYFKLGEIDSAKYYSDFYKYRPYNRFEIEGVDSIYGRGIECSRKKNYKEALECLNVVEQKIASIYGSNNMHLNKIWIEQAKLQYMLNHHPNAINILTKVWYNYDDSLGPCKKWKEVGDLLLRCYYDEGNRENYIKSERLDSNTVIIKRTDTYKTGLFLIGENSDITLILPMEYKSIHKIDERFLFVDVDFEKHFIFDFSNWRHSKPFTESNILRHICDANGVPVFLGFETIIDFNGRVSKYPMSLSYCSVNGDKVCFEIDSINFYVNKDSILNPINTINNVFPEKQKGKYGDYMISSIYNKKFIVAYTNGNIDNVGLFNISRNKVKEILPIKFNKITLISNDGYYIATKGRENYIVNPIKGKVTKLKGIVDESDIYWSEEDSIPIIDFNGKKLFYCGAYRKTLIDMEGNVYHLPIGFIIDKFENNYYCRHYKHDLKIPLSEFPLGKFCEYRIKDKGIKVPNWHYSIRMDYPIEKSILSKNVRSWMSEILGSYYSREVDNPYRMYRHYAKLTSNSFFSKSDEEKEDIINHKNIEDFDAYKIWEDSLYITYNWGYSWDYGGPHGHENTQLVTFDKRTARRVSINELFDAKDSLILHNKLYKLISEELKKRSGDWEKLDFSPDICPLGNVALTPQGIVFQYDAYEIASYSMGAFDIVIPYEHFRNIIKLPPMSTSTQNVFVESLKRANSFYESVEFEKSQDVISNFEQCNILKKEYGENSGEYINSIISLSASYFDKGEFEEATLLTKKYIQLIEHNSNTALEAYLTGLKTLIDCYYKLEEYNNAISTCYQILELYKVKYFMNESKSIYKFAPIYSQLAKAYWKMGISDSALFYQERYLPYSLLDNINAIMDVAEYANACGQIQKSLNYTHQIFGHDWGYDSFMKETTWQEKILSLLKRTKSLDRTTLRNKYIPWFQNFLPKLSMSSNDSTIICETYNALLFSKNILLNIEQSIRNMILSSQDTSIIKPYLELQKSKQQLIKFASIKDERLREELVQKVTDEMNCLELDLMEKSKVYSNSTKMLQIDFNDVRRNLHNGEIAIEFANSSDSIYYALVLSSNKETPTIIKLCSSAELKGQSANLYNLIWNPILSCIDSTKSIYFSPAGELYKLPIEYVSNASGQFLNEEYGIYRLSSTREIVLSRDSMFTNIIESNENAILYGYIDYYADKLYTKKNVKKLITQNKKHSITTNLKRAGLLRSNVERLEYTEQEISEIDSLLTNNKYAKVDAIYKNEDGTESSLKSYSGSRIKILHLATHGFYITKSEMDNFKKIDFLSLDSMNIDDIEDKELVRSGLLFAGANHTLESDGVIPEDVDDGILTSLEVASLDLIGLDLVVLSACQTAQGDLTDDGVIGLQRGFKKAGAHSILMSLWKVNDEATQILMTQFYKNLTSGKSKRESLISAQKYLRMYNNGIYSAPEYWAAFILLDGIK